MKKIICVILVALMFTATALASTPVIIDVNGRLNVHAAPDKDSAVIDRLEDGDVVLCEFKKGGWLYIDTGFDRKGNKTYGYIDPYFTTPMYMFENYTVSATGLFVRNAAAEDAEIIGKLKAGTKVSAVELDGSWVYIDCGGKCGWVAAKYLTK